MPQPWPDSLPQQFDKDGYQDAFADNRHTTQTDVGPALIRSRVSSMPRRVTGVMKMKKSQLDRLRQFWKTDTLDGKLPFLFPDPIFGYGYRKNWIPNSSYAGAVIGNPGTLPTYWGGVGTQSGIYKRVAGVGVEEGMQYVDIGFSGTPSGNGVAEVWFSNSIPTPGGIPSTSGQIWTQSMYLRMVAGSKINLTNIGLVMYNLPITIGIMKDIMSQLSSSELRYQRYQQTWTPVATGMNGVQSRLRVTGDLGIFIDITIRVAGLQMEKLHTATSFMPTPNTTTPIARFAAGGRPPQPIFMGGETWAVNLELEIFEV